jgi:hypothetical protein
LPTKYDPDKGSKKRRLLSPPVKSTESGKRWPTQELKSGDSKSRNNAGGMNWPLNVPQNGKPRLRDKKELGRKVKENMDRRNREAATAAENKRLNETLAHAREQTAFRNAAIARANSEAFWREFDAAVANYNPPRPPTVIVEYVERDEPTYWGDPDWNDWAHLKK